MRNLSAASLAKIAQRTGNEPINVVRVWWTFSGYIDYADRTFGTVQGKLLTLSDVEDVINVQGNSSSTSVQVSLDDTDGSLKEIFNNTDIHRRRVQILQWFSDIPYGEAFVIFEGEIASPVTWNEGDVTLSFDVLSKLYDQEVGFSAEEGQFNWVPPELVGQAWPLVFGTVRNLRGLRITSVPGGLTGEATGVTEATDYNKQRAEIETKLELLRIYANYCFIQAVECYAISDQYVTIMKIDRLGGGDTDYSSEISTWKSNGDNYLQQGNQYLQERYQLQKELNKLALEKSQKDLLAKQKISALGVKSFPSKQISFVNIGGSQYQGYFDAGFFNVTQQPKPFDDNYTPAGLTTITDGDLVKKYETQLPPNRFVFHQGGSSIVIGGFYPTTYIVGLGFLTVLGLVAKRNGIDVGVPTNYWRVQYNQLGTLRYTTIVLTQPLSSLMFNTTNASGGTTATSQGWEDEIFITCVGEVPPLPSVIMRWFINTYTPYGVDEASWEAARVYIDRYPMNFALLERPNVLALLADLAFQSRCAIWYNDGKFHLKFLAVEADAIETITEDDVDMNSLQVEYTSTEDLVTKFVATWTLDYNQEFPNKIIYRNNIPRYGTIEETHDFFAYTLQACVEKMSEFWIIRKSNTFKRISFRTFLTKLKVETWDTILLNFGARSIVANGPVKAIVESAKFDTSSWKVVITAWVPVRAGEMSQFLYAWPANLPVEYVYPNPSVAVLTPNGVLPGTLDAVQPPDAQQTSSGGRGGPVGDQHDQTTTDPDYEVQVQLDSREINPGIQPLFPPESFKQYDIKPPIALPALNNSEADVIYFGTVGTSLGDNKYNVTIPATDGGDDVVVNATQFAIRQGEIIPEGTPTMVVRKTVRVASTSATAAGAIAGATGGVSGGGAGGGTSAGTGKPISGANNLNGTAAIQAIGGGGGAAAAAINGGVKRLYYMQVPVWVKPQPAEGGGGSSPPTSPPPPPPPSEPGSDFGDTGDEDTGGDSGEDAEGDGIIDAGGGPDTSGGDVIV